MNDDLHVHLHVHVDVDDHVDDHDHDHDHEKRHSADSSPLPPFARAGVLGYSPARENEAEVPIFLLALGLDVGGSLSRDELADLYTRTGALVLRRCRLLLGDLAEAEDALQDVFLRVMRYGRFVRASDVPLAWLYRTAERCCFDRLRARRREVVADPAELADAMAGPDVYADRETRETIARFFHRLDPRVQQVALLHYVDGLTQERIAAELGWSRRTVGKKLDELRRRADRLSRTQERRP